MSDRAAAYAKYAVWGALTFVVYLAAGTLFLRIWPQEAMAASVAFVLAVTFNYSGQQAWVFRGRVAMSTSMPRYAVMVMAGLVLNAAVVWVLARHVPMTIAQTGGAATVILANAFISFAWVYACRPRSGLRRRDAS